MNSGKIVAWLLFPSFLIIAILAHFIPYFSFDLQISRGLQALQNPYIFSFMNFITQLGNGISNILILLIISILLWKAHYKREAFILLFSSPIVALLNYVLKYIIGRPRPSSDLVHILADGNGLSFPSGHGIRAMVFWGFLVYFMSVRIKNKFLKISGIIICVLLIILTGISRIYLGAHWFSDVLASYLLGIILLFLFIKVYNSLR